MIGVQWTLLPLCLQKRRKLASHLTATCQVLWDRPMFPQLYMALLIFQVVFPTGFIYCQILLTLLSL